MGKNKHRKKGNAMPAKRSRERNPKLDEWKDRLAESDRDFAPEVDKMDKRERAYNGNRELKPLIPGEMDQGVRKTSHVRNIIFENIESQISSSIPQPKVTPVRKEDEHLAEIIERFLRNELNRLPFEMINDMAERTVPIQGGVGFFVEWDNSKRTHCTIGEVHVSLIHPKQFAPQPGIYTGIEDMDWFIIKMPTTKNAIMRKYGVDVYDESDSEPDIKTVSSQTHTEEALTQYIGFEINETGGINRFSWVNDVVLEDLENYQARRQPVCTKCGRVRPLHGQIIANQAAGVGNLLPDPASGSEGGLIPDEVMAGHLMAQQLAEQAVTGAGTLENIPVAAAEAPEPVKYDGGPCPWCGSEEFEDREQEYEQVMLPITTAGGVSIPGQVPGLDDMGNPVMKPTLIPFYKPDMFPIVLQRSVSVYGQLLGNSDVDAISDQQNTINRMEQKIIDRLLKAGCRVTLPDNVNFRIDSNDYEKWYIGNAADKHLIGLYEFKGNLQYELAYLSQVYEEARQILGITNSIQGRPDPTATSGKAKEFSAAQAAGRQESKRIMKNAAYAMVFELMFKNWLAYSDEPRPISFKNFKGETEYQEFNRYDFLKKDSDGQYYWNDQFLFSCDTTAPLASNREAMWQETRMNLQTGAFGDPKSTETLILFWGKMEELHYPGAASTKQYLEEKLQREQAAMQQQMMQQQALMAQQQAAGNMTAPAMGVR